MSDLQCPVCKSDSYLNPNIKLYISPCYHKMCEACLSYTFQAGQAPCPECGSMLRKVNYVTQTFEDLSVEKECRVRKMLRKFMRSEEDFATMEEYNDYLEEVEDRVMEILEADDPSNLIADLKQQYKVTKKKETVVESRVQDEGTHPETSGWFDGIVFEEFHFGTEIVLLDAFKPRNTAGGCLDTTMAYKAYFSLFSVRI